MNIEEKISKYLNESSEEVETKRFVGEIEDVIKHSPITEQEYDEILEILDRGEESGYYVNYAKETSKMLKKKTKSTDPRAKKLIAQCKEIIGIKRGRFRGEDDDFYDA